LFWLRPFRIERALIRRSFLVLFFKKELLSAICHVAFAWRLLSRLPGQLQKKTQKTFADRAELIRIERATSRKTSAYHLPSLGDLRPATLESKSGA
jgi:hypothetical protein